MQKKYEKGTTRIWGNPLKWMCQVVSPGKYRSEFVFVYYHFPLPLVVQCKGNLSTPIYLDFTPLAPPRKRHQKCPEKYITN